MVIIRRWNPARVNNLPYYKKEIANAIRNRKGVHVFLHWYRLKLNNLPTVQKRIIIDDNNIQYTNHNYNDDGDGDDNDYVIFRYPVIAQTGFVFWGLLSERMK